MPRHVQRFLRRIIVAAVIGFSTRGGCLKCAPLWHRPNAYTVRVTFPKSSVVPEDAIMSEKIIVITGASAGIGAAAAEHLAGQGHSVAIVARRKNELDRVAAQCRGR